MEMMRTGLCVILYGIVMIVAKAEIDASNLAVIANKNDPVSVQIAEYYLRARRIPRENLAFVKLDSDKTTVKPGHFRKIKQRLDAELPSSVQSIVLTWVQPYRVGCMSITSAFAFGFDKAFCSKNCGATRSSAYFDSNSGSPYEDYKIRPTISLAAENFSQAKNLIDRGVASDSSFPAGTGYLVSTSDKDRNVRSTGYQYIVNTFPRLPRIKVVKADYVENRDDVLFYFTGLKFVPKINTNKFVPGAIADHLTSTGGMLTGSRQMSALKWLEAGATGSYGTIKEPCNFRQKFPNPEVLIRRYIRGETLIEAYWKSVAWPGEGIFIGEPLASPFKLRTQRKN